MNDMRRTLLWVVFSMSLFLIWDAWNKHNGQPSLFSPAPTTKPAAVGAAPGASAIPVPTAGAAAPLAAPAPAAPASAATAASDKVSVTTDLINATLDGKGGDLVRVEFLKHHDQVDHTKNMLLLDQSTDRLYVAQTGLVPPSGGAGLPNHHTVMTLVPGETRLKDGANELQVKFESPEVSGVKLLKTYTFKRGDYVIGVKHEIVNASSAPVNPRLYLQLVRDGNAPAGESSFYFTFTGPAIYTDASKFTKIDFKTIEKHRPGDLYRSQEIPES